MAKITFIRPNKERVEIEAPLGVSLLDLAREHGLDELEGACDGSLACSTCHVIVDKQWYDTLSEPTDDENDMLDMAFGLTGTSRLGCQIIVTKALDGLTIEIPPATRNMLLEEAT